MSWGYRVVKYVTKIPLGETDISYGIHEVFYDENKEISNISEKPTLVISDDVDGIMFALKRMMRACNKPVIDYHTGEEI